MRSTQFDVVCVGNTVADIFASPLPRLPAPGEVASVEDVLLQTGGCAANVAADLVRLGVTAAVVGRVGNDLFGEFIRRDLAERGVDISGIRLSASEPTARTIILPVSGEDRRYIHSVGAGAELTVEDIGLQLVGKARALYVGGYFLLPSLSQASLVKLFQFARDRGVKTILDVAGAKLEQGIEPLAQLLPHTDVFLPNDDEAQAITGETDPIRQTQALVDYGVGLAIVTLGNRGAVARSKEQAVQASAFRVEVVDPSGAGDAFDAGFIYGLLKGRDLLQTLEFASAIGASACTKLGCTAGVFNEAEAVSFLAHNQIIIKALD